LAILTVSRLYGSGGSEVAAIVAKTLGWSLLDNAVVDAVAMRMGLSVAEVQAREERVPSLVERLTSAMAMGSQEWMSPIADTRRPTDEQLIEVTRHIIEEAIARGPVVARMKPRVSSTRPTSSGTSGCGCTGSATGGRSRITI